MRPSGYCSKTCHLLQNVQEQEWEQSVKAWAKQRDRVQRRRMSHCPCTPFKETGQLARRGWVQRGLRTLRLAPLVVEDLLARKTGESPQSWTLEAAPTAEAGHRATGLAGWAPGACWTPLACDLKSTHGREAEAGLWPQGHQSLHNLSSLLHGLACIATRFPARRRSPCLFKRKKKG